ncbi:type II toxin-antitoxin system RnlB family antitoxin [Paenibacillus sp. sgz500992]|uniref:type II toxin-antitoxin system RnlB family antitoxin n=1 Tax=Paenibacillus sp. sgz500992 TaxID=3242476 RepID=UPI0036D358E7
MMKGYELLQLSCDDFEYLVLSTSFETPLTYLMDITTELNSKSNMSNFKVVFDLLLSMGNNSERFIEAFYDGEQKNIDLFNVLKIDKKNDLRKISCEYLKQNSIFLDNSVLNSQQKKMISMGIPI